MGAHHQGVGGADRVGAWLPVRTAKALGIDIPPMLHARSNEVLE